MGNTALYWFEADFWVQSRAGIRTYQASVWDEPIGNSGNARIRHVVWYEARSTDAVLHLSIPASALTTNLVMHVGRLEAMKADSITFDSASEIEGSIPATSKEEGGSLWMSGDFSVSVSPLGKVEDSDRGHGRYRVEVSGTSTSYSFGGGSPITFGPAELATSGLVLAAIAAALAFRDLIVFAAGRITIPLYTKLRRDRLFNVHAREEIYRAIQQTPGINFLALHREIRSRSGGSRIAFGSLAYHLSQMERFEFVVSKREGRFRRYYDVAARLGADSARVALLQTQPVPLVALTVMQNPGLSQTALHQKIISALPVRRQTLAYHLKRLVAKDLVVRESIGRFTRYQPTDRLKRLAHLLSPVAPTTDSADLPDQAAPNPP